ncbi:hypothetical protein D3C80_1390090 [compost metagenome]
MTDNQKRIPAIDRYIAIALHGLEFRFDSRALSLQVFLLAIFQLAYQENESTDEEKYAPHHCHHYSATPQIKKAVDLCILRIGWWVKNLNFFPYRVRGRVTAAG